MATLCILYIIFILNSKLFKFNQKTTNKYLTNGKKMEFNSITQNYYKLLKTNYIYYKLINQTYYIIILEETEIK